MSSESVFAAILGIVLLGEVMTINVLIGCGLILVAVLVIEVEFKHKDNKIKKSISSKNVS